MHAAGPESGAESAQAAVRVAEAEDYFQAFGVSRKFEQDRKALEKRFYDLSRILHPDRFSSAAFGPEARRLSLERMSYLNQAWSTLKSPQLLRDYLLGLEGFDTSKPQGNAQIPMELAESWFELQDAVMEEPDTALARVQDFELGLRKLSLSNAAAILELEKSHDSQGGRDLLKELGEKIRSESYLRSLERDVERLKNTLMKTALMKKNSNIPGAKN
ncbi:MAG: hypothetical protein H7222_04740 [Methylotenera sp.]|nr:hypothetical protein [Oligoflexia bacterium]